MDEFQRSLKGRTARGRLARRLAQRGLNEVQYSKCLSIWKARSMSHKDCEYIISLLESDDISIDVPNNPKIPLSRTKLLEDQII